MDNRKYPFNDTKKIFLNQGPCSTAFFYILNREFGNVNTNYEKAAAPLCGGVMQKGFQCGMLWGSSLAASKEIYKKYGNTGWSMQLAINTTKELMNSFTQCNGSVDCREVTQTDFAKKFQFVKFIFVSFLYKIFKKSCFNIADKWAPFAVETAVKNVNSEISKVAEPYYNCAYNAVINIGGTEEEAFCVSGFAGGMGLSGNACGVLSAALWYNTNKYILETGKGEYPNPAATETYAKFLQITNNEMLCSKICSQKFNTLKEHSDFIKTGGCKNIIEGLKL